MAETAEDTDIGHLTLFKKKTGASTYVTLAEVTEITFPEFARDSVEFTHMSSPDRYREFKPGLIDPGEVGIVYNLIPGEADDDVVADHIATGTVDEWEIEFPNGAKFAFKAFATAHSRATPIDDRMTGSATFKVSGKPTLTPAA
jgi:hypothetical protein